MSIGNKDKFGADKFNFPAHLKLLRDQERIVPNQSGGRVDQSVCRVARILKKKSLSVFSELLN